MSLSCSAIPLTRIKTLDGKVGDDLKASLEGKGLKVLAYWENGWRDVTNSRAPVKNPPPT
ncbi:hypothetical protein KZ779_15990 [Escherichia coli]|nr:hypothetical protein [Escherichia coli]